MIVIKSDHVKPNCIERAHTKNKLSDFFGKSCNKYYKDYPYTEKINKKNIGKDEGLFSINNRSFLGELWLLISKIGSIYN